MNKNVIMAVAFVIGASLGLLVTKAIKDTSGTNPVTSQGQKSPILEPIPEPISEPIPEPIPDSIAEPIQEPAQEPSPIILAKNRMSATQLQSLLLDHNDNTLLASNPMVAKNLRFTFKGTKNGEKMPYDAIGIRGKIADEIWASARVVGVDYDSMGRICKATIEVVYKNDNESND